MGTRAACTMCEAMVELVALDSGRLMWRAASDPADGGRYCDGGTSAWLAEPMWTPHHALGVWAERHSLAR